MVVVASLFSEGWPIFFDQRDSTLLMLPSYSVIHMESLKCGSVKRETMQDFYDAPIGAGLKVVNMNYWNNMYQRETWNNKMILSRRQRWRLDFLNVIRSSFRIVEQIIPHSTEYCKNMSEIFEIFHCNWNIVAIFLSNIAKYFTATF